MRLILASTSPRRAQLLSQIGLVFETADPGIDESRYPEEEPIRYVERIARSKAMALATQDAVVVAGDTTVVHEGRIMGKPAHPEEARSMLRRLQGDHHEVLTGLAVAAYPEDSLELRSLVAEAEVRMETMTDDEIASYVATGEPLDKAGAYALQGIGGRFVKELQGHPTTVVGLPVHLLARLIEAVSSSIDAFTVPPTE